ncbi:SWIB/MDM2 domain-containing protein [Phycomyces blakesleeanus]
MQNSPHTAHSPSPYPTPRSPSHVIDTSHDPPRTKRAYKRKTEDGTTSVDPKVKPKKPRVKRKPKPKDPEDANAPPKPKRKTGLNKPLIPSPALSAVLGGDTELSRPEIVKKLWFYIKSNELQDPVDRRFILCDHKLRSLFGQDRINSFRMNRDLSAHLTNTTIDTHSQFDFKSKDEFCLGVLFDQKNDLVPVVCVSPTGTADTPDVMTPMEGYHV